LDISLPRIFAKAECCFDQDYLPFLKYAPSCFAFQRKARKWRTPVRAMLDTPFISVKEEMVRVSLPPFGGCDICSV
jgi:hypothetical protein